jgi:hypothetical protein
MTASSEIPYPRLTRRYVGLKDRSSEQRLQQANATTATELVEEFLESARAFSQFSTEGLTADGEFFPATRTDDGKDPKSDSRTFGWAMAMKGMEAVPVTGGNDLEFRYVAREIIPTRTKPQLGFASGEGKHVRVDFVLANAATGRPIVGELKIASDKDPFAGLVQALAGAAQLVSPHQRARLSKLPRPLASIEDEPLLDVYVLLGNFPTTGRDRFQQLERAVALATELEANSALGQQLGRVQVLALQRAAITVTTELPSAPDAR